MAAPFRNRANHRASSRKMRQRPVRELTCSRSPRQKEMHHRIGSKTGLPPRLRKGTRILAAPFRNRANHRASGTLTPSKLHEAVKCAIGRYVVIDTKPSGYVFTLSPANGRCSTGSIIRCAGSGEYDSAREPPRCSDYRQQPRPPHRRHAVKPRHPQIADALPNPRYPRHHSVPAPPAWDRRDNSTWPSSSY